MRFIFLLILLFSVSLPAEIGESIDLIKTDGWIETSLSTKDKYFIHEYRRDDYLGTLRAYVTFDNKLFAVAWTGMTHLPDKNLRTLLGPVLEKEMDRYPKKHNKKGSRRNTLDSDKLVIRKKGHGRKLEGVAISKMTLPKGVNPDEIQ